MSRDQLTAALSVRSAFRAEHEAAVLNGLSGERTPLTRDELDEVRNIATRGGDSR